MADYWKSQPRHFCEICKCWFGDNKISIQHHEGGRRHQANVEKMLKEARRKATKTEKEAVRVEQTLDQIEREALKAYQRDLEADAGLPYQKSAQSAILEREIEKEKMKKMIEDQLRQQEEAKEVEKKTGKRKSSATKEAEPAIVTQPKGSIVPPPPPSPWQQLVSPEGCPYYYNILSGVSQWEVPPDFQLVDMLPTQSSSSTAPALSATSHPHSTTMPANQDKDGAEQATMGPGDSDSRLDRKRAVKDGGEGDDSQPPPQKRPNPYGAWTTVALRPQEPAVEEKDDEEESERESTELTSSDEETRDFKFGEKELPAATSPTKDPVVVPGNFKGFSFKKRTVARSQLKQRTSDW